MYVFQLFLHATSSYPHPCDMDSKFLWPLFLGKLAKCRWNSDLQINGRYTCKSRLFRVSTNTFRKKSKIAMNLRPDDDSPVTSRFNYQPDVLRSKISLTLEWRSMKNRQSDILWISICGCNFKISIEPKAFFSIFVIPKQSHDSNAYFLTLNNRDSFTDVKIFHSKNGTEWYRYKTWCNNSYLE